MIAFLKGEIAEKFEGKILIDVNGIGYAVLVSNTTLTTIGNVGENVLIHTFMQVREDGVTLIGFSSLEEKNLFELLITINGIGAKMALGILSGMKLTDIIVSIASGDSIALSQIKGLGKKTAERIVLELKDKVSPSGIPSQNVEANTINEEAMQEAFSVLLSLGLSKNEAASLARRNSNGYATAEEIVAKALKEMGGNNGK